MRAIKLSPVSKPWSLQCVVASEGASASRVLLMVSNQAATFTKKIEKEALTPNVKNEMVK